MDQARNWLSDQPFSRRPAIHGSFIATTFLDDFTRAEEIARAGLVANPRDFSLLNNLAVALAKSGRERDAASAIARIRPSDLSIDNRIVWLATNGLIQFRLGLLDAGRALYRASIDEAHANDRNSVRARAAISLAIEELARGTAESTVAVIADSRSREAIN